MDVEVGLDVGILAVLGGAGFKVRLRGSIPHTGDPTRSPTSAIFNFRRQSRVSFRYMILELYLEYGTPLLNFRYMIL